MVLDLRFILIIRVYSIFYLVGFEFDAAKMGRVHGDFNTILSRLIREPMLEPCNLKVS